MAAMPGSTDRAGIAFTVNGIAHISQAAGTAPLLYILRNDLGLTGAKLGCGTGNCGACTVIVNGRAVQSCQAPLWSIAGSEVRTIEALGTADEPGVVQQAFLDAGAAQCGYCIPGIIMTVEAIRARGERPDRAALTHELAERHLCRCGTHTRIIAAARAALA